MGKKSSLQNICVLGCETYVHVPKKNWSKLVNKETKFIFIGYGPSVKGYNIWDPMDKKLVQNRDIVFREVKYSPIEVQPKEGENKLIV